MTTGCGNVIGSIFNNYLEIIYLFIFFGKILEIKKGAAAFLVVDGSLPVFIYKYQNNTLTFY